MAVAGTLTYKTEVDQSGIQKGLNKTSSIIKGVLGGLGIAKAVSVAMNSIRTSIDGAVSRVDTLNNFPKVMSNLGISAEDSSKSIKKMSDRLTGLPTTLDQGASAVQRFTSANGDVAKSTDIFLALNNAILAGGASTEIQASALEQLSQSYAKGKMDMMEWRSIQTAMPAQLNQVAKAMGMTADELGEGLRKGTISMDDFMNTIVQLNEEGIEGFASFEEQARNSTSGIATAVTVAKTQVVKGVADIIESLNSSLTKANLPSISEIIALIGKKAKEVLDIVADNMDNIIRLAPILAGLFGTIKVGVPLLNGMSGALSLIPGKFGLIAGAIAKVAGLLAGGAGIIGGIGAITTVFGSKIDKMITIATTKGPQIIRGIITGITSALPELLSKGMSFITEMINLIMTMLPEIITAVIQVISQVATAIGQQLPTLIPIVINGIINMVMAIIDNIDKFIDAGIELTLGLILGLSRGLIEAIPKLIEKIPEIITKLVLKLTEPEMLMKIIAASVILIQSLAKGLIQAIPQLLLMVPRIIISLFNGFKDRIKNTNWLELGKNILKTILNGLIDIGKTAVEVGKLVFNIYNSVFSKIKNTNWLELGKNILRGILNGMLNFGSLVKNTVAKMGSKIVNDIKSFFKIKSPSKIMEDEVGQWLPKGIAVGITANTDSILDTLDDMYKEMDTAIQEENGKLSLNSVSGDIYNKTIYSTPDIINENTLLLDGEVVYENQQKVSARKNLQTQFGGAYSVSN